MKRLALLALTLVSCGRNAFFEIDVVLPKNDTGKTRYAVVAFAPDGQEYDAIWAGSQTLDGVLLTTSGTVTQHASIEGPDGGLDRPVEAKVSFCENPTCTASGDDRAPEVWLKIERAFYEGERTAYTWTIACIPSSTGGCAVPDSKLIEVTKCEVSGCRSGTSSNYCVGDKHFCE